MNNVSSEIFKAYDIRGVYGEDITEETAETIGKGAGTFFQKNNISKIIVGRDNRISSPSISESLIKGLAAAGCEVINLGISLTPFMYFSWYKLDANATIMVTASHNSAKFIGFKMSMNKKPLIEENYQEIRQICQEEKFSAGQGKTQNYETIFQEYKKEILGNIKLARPLKIVIDCGNGTAGLFAPEILKSLDCEVTAVYCESDGRFPNHDPYPQKTEYYKKLISLIKENKADIGLSFDGDGDRLGVYDEQGKYLEGDRLAMIVFDEVSKNCPSPKVVMSVNTTLSVKDYITGKGGEFFFSKTGYPNTTRLMDKVGAVFGGEISGHFHFKDRYYGYDDGIYSACRILEVVAQSQEPLSMIVARLPRYFETKEIRTEIPKEVDKFALVREVAQELKAENPESEVLDIDGYRFSFPDAWFLIRASNTEQLIGVRAEAKTSEKLEMIKQMIQNKMTARNINLSWE